jgi:HlyD family secretion protein
MKSGRTWAIVIGLLIVVGLGIGGFLFVRSRQQAAAPKIVFGDVTQITAVSAVETTGSVAPQQSGSASWTTIGLINAVNVKVGDTVKKGTILMMLEPATVPQNVIMAQADLINAQKVLDDLLHPTELSVSNAQKAVADATDALKTARKDLTNVENPASKALYDAVNDAKLALQNAQTTATLNRVSADSTALKTTEDSRNLAYTRLQRAQVAMDDCNKISCGERVQRENELTAAQQAYQTADNNYQAALLKFQNNTVNQADSVAKAQKKYDDAVANLNSALQGPDQNKLAIAKSKVAVAEASLADAQNKLDKLTKGADPKDVAAAQARVLAAEATVASLAVFAPFDGEVVAVNYQVGDTAVTGQPAVTLVNRTKLHLDVAVDESDVSHIRVGNPVTLTFDSLPEVSLKGQVVQVNPLGATVQGLVKYTVRVNVDDTNPQVLIGMTANVKIVTDTNTGALAVPLDAVQLDQQGEFVMRQKADGSTERVDIKSGQVQGDEVVVTGPLKPGEKVQVVKPVPTRNGSPFGG